MIGFIIRRLGYAIPVLMGVALITLLLFNVAGGDPIAIKLGKNPSEAEVAALTAELGLNDPLWKQYIDFLRQVVTLNFGTSWTDNTPVREIFWRGVGPTLSLSLPAFSIGSLIAVAAASESRAKSKSAFVASRASFPALARALSLPHTSASQLMLRVAP